MPAVQPIPQSPPDPAEAEAAKVLATHNRATESRTQTGRFNPPVKRGKVTGENSGRKVK